MSKIVGRTMDPAEIIHFGIIVFVSISKRLLIGE